MIICEIIVHLSVVVQNKKQPLFESNMLKISVLIRHCIKRQNKPRLKAV